MDGGTTTEFVDAGSIHKDMFVRIVKADLVVCDITVHNANVFYELGVRHALRRRHTVLIKGEPSSDGTPFDIAGLRYLSYAIDEPRGATDALIAALNATTGTQRATDSPVFMTMPSLPEANVGCIVEIPTTFVEAVQRAEACKDKTALARLAEDARGTVYEREAFKAVGRALWVMNEVDAAVATWEAAAQSADDLDTQLALSNLYERQYKRSRELERLERSTQTIRRVLDQGELPPAVRAEAQALLARNLKTQWRQAFDHLGTEVERRERAIDRRAKDCYEAYLAAHRADLNHFFSGLTALQMGRILQSLSAHPKFVNLFGGSAAKAHRYLEDLGEQLGQIEPVVGAAIQQAVEASRGDARVWAAISAADLLFLGHARGTDTSGHSAVVQAYRDAIPSQRGFYWDSARGQLALFERLGIGADLARAVMHDIEAQPFS
ncbi:tetratricopeptide repeat-containing protein [Roseateles sp. DB2]|uniref:tetratricopeptide repeat-containing protein n=1 Tax=Roseateles sp. DB2 TaxID=3453717 RepID=UPI003EEC01FE